MKKITIHQPEHLPWLGFWDKVRQVDEVVLLDNVQFEKNYFQNRNKIKSRNGFLWITVPVLMNRSSQKINEIKIDNSKNWRRKCWGSIMQCYMKSKYWDDYSLFFNELYQTEWTSLIDLNLHIIRFLADEFGINKKFYLASDLKPEGASTELLLDICEKVGADCYLSGASGKNYLNEDLFKSNNIEVEYQNFNHPVYPQLYGDFVDGLSSIDLLFNCGKDSLSIIEEFNKWDATT